MKHAQPRGLSRRRVEKLLSIGKSNGSAGSRMELFSRQFLGNSYSTTLIGSAEEPEVFTADLDAFDCVTYVETVLALSLSSKAAEFVEWLRKIRYEDGRIDWKRRNHYMTGWIRSNARLGAVRPVVSKVPFVAKARLLNVVPGLAPTRARFRCIPKASARRFAAELKTGDLVFFASTRKHLDVFHCGILIRDSATLKMRHASRSQKGVVEQDLDQFLKNNRMAGLIVARPAGERKG